MSQELEFFLYCVALLTLSSLLFNYPTLLNIGFGYLMTFLRKYGLGAVGFTMLLTALGMQLSVFMEMFVRNIYGSDHHAHFPLEVNMMTMIDSEFFAAALLISYGAVIGRASPICLLFVGATETATPSNEERCVINTILALLGSTVATFAASAYLVKNKFDAVHIANSTLAGGVAVVFLGTLAGTVSVYGYFSVSNSLQDRFEISDTCGVHNLHGLPAVVGGLAGAVFVTLDSSAEFLTYGRPGQTWRQVAATAATVALACASGYLTGLVLRYTKRSDDEFYEYDDSVYWWEGEFYETVNTVGDVDGAAVTAHELSLSGTGKTIASGTSGKAKGAAVYPDVPIEAA
jgi:hypothetical protein